ncbi:hypothetical protein VOLCADRAFT_92191 [Volvox carteri f. nagariensis]|uniref:Uncharacterized protein n=1 Tax=Volvox carteri f. nagariensis TaxID=3068 RepID=D8TYU8_VOLCA|nr:uncharacterized protein VOLCADRAFT_92191 [Volvox carteri f. nagariensis]EFJ47376.1 hypothetical protein VOLCADRAFT_92191 [Volvox carteri f. nagariensis]|eukprot:XP_002951565.1 hypothetical protein VOLCADRAFT_92191 [Volvox carteri f. nagariensis]
MDAGVANPAFGGSSARDSSLAGTNTVVPQFVFKGILRAPTLALQLPSVAASVTGTAAPVASGASTASLKTSAVILRQQPQRQASPQPQLRAPRCSSPPMVSSGIASRRRSSPADTGASGCGGGGGVGPDGGSASPRGGRATYGCDNVAGSPRATGVSRCRSSPRDRHVSVVSNGVRGSGGGDGGSGLLTAGQGGPSMATGGDVAGGEGAADSGAAQPARGRPRNTITRTAALRALKQQRSTTPDIIAELRAVASIKAAQQADFVEAASLPTAARVVGGVELEPTSAGDTSATIRQQQEQQYKPNGPHEAGGASAKAGSASGTQPCNATLGDSVPASHTSYGASTTAGRAGGLIAGSAADTSPHPPAHPPAQQHLQPPQKRCAPHESQGHVQKQLRQQQSQPQPQLQLPQQLKQLQVQQPKSQEPSTASPTAAIGRRGTNLPLEAVAAGSHCSGPALVATVAAVLPQPASASSVSACRDAGAVWEIGEEPSFRSPSPQRAKGAASREFGQAVPQVPAAIAAPVSAALGPVAAAAAAAPTAAAIMAVAQRQQRAMRQHVQRQSSPSPGRRNGQAPGPLTDKQTAARTSLSPQPQHRLRGLSMEGGSWQSDVVMAAQARIRRLEEQVVSLSAQVAELQASHADLEFQLEEEQQHTRAAAARADAAAPACTPQTADAGQAHAMASSRWESDQHLQEQVREVEERLKAREAELDERLKAREAELEGRLKAREAELDERLKAREAELEEQVMRERAANDSLAKQNRALYSTLEETLSAAEHEVHDTSQKEVSQLKEDLELRERALSAVQAEFSALRRRHEEMSTAAEAARRDNALRDGRLRREVEVATQDAAILAAQLTKLQREHQQLHSRKAEKDRQLATLAKRADAQQEQLTAAERLAQEQAALVRELESRATLLRNRNAALDRAVAAEKEARQAAQEQVRQMEEEIALLVSIVRQSDPNLETLTRYKRDPAAAAAMAAAAAAAAAAALLQASPSSAHGIRGEEGTEVEGGQAADGDYGVVAPIVPPLILSGRGNGGLRRQHDPYGHSVVTITAGSGPAAATRTTAPQPLPFAIPGSAPLSVRAPPPGSQPLSHRQQRADAEAQADISFADAASVDCDAILQPSPQAATGDTPRQDPDSGSAHAPNRRYAAASREDSPLTMPYPAKHNMTGGVFLDIGGNRGPFSTSPRGVLSPIAAGRAHTSGGAGLHGTGFTSASPRLRQETRLAATTGGGGGNGCRNARTPLSRRGSSAGLRGRRRSDVSTAGFCSAASNGGHLAATWSGADVSGGSAVAKAAAPVWRGAGIARRSATPPGTSAVRRGRDSQSLLGPDGAGAFVTVPSGAVSFGGVAAKARTAVTAPSAATVPKAAGIGTDVPQPSAAAAVPVEAVLDGSLSDRALWAKPRRSSRSDGSCANGRSGGGGGQPAGPRVGSQVQQLSYAAIHTAQRALATSALTVPAAAAARCHSRSRSCSAMEWIRPRVTTRSRASRRAMTPEPRTVAAWLKLSEEAAAAAAAAAAAGDALKHSHSEITIGRGSYKLGPLSSSDGGAFAGAGAGAVRCSDAASELAALLEQHPLGLRAQPQGGRAGASRAVCILTPHAEGQECEREEESTGAAKHSGDSCGHGSPAGAANESRGGDGGESDGNGGCSWGVGLDDSKMEMASPVKLSRASGGQAGARHCLADSRDSHEDVVGDASTGRRRTHSPDGVNGGKDNSSGSPSRENTRGVCSATGRPSAIIRASYAFDSPLRRQKQQPQQAAGAAKWDHVSSPTAARSSLVAADGSDEVDPLGSVLRSLQKRQAALLIELATGGGGNGGSPSAVVKPLLLIPGSSPRNSLALNRSKPAEDPSFVASFTFANPKPQTSLLSASSEKPNGGRGTADEGTDSDKNWTADAARGSRPQRRRSMSFTGEEAKGVPKGGAGGASGDPRPLAQPLRNVSSSREGGCWAAPQVIRQPTPPPPPPPPRSPHRPSVTAAAAAAAAAGAGVGGPLTALLGQLEHSGGTWRGNAAHGEQGGPAGPHRLSDGSTDVVPSSPLPSPPPQQQQQQPSQQQQWQKHEQPEQGHIVTHFSVTAALQMPTGKFEGEKSGEDQQRQRSHQNGKADACEPRGSNQESNQESLRVAKPSAARCHDGEGSNGEGIEGEEVFAADDDEVFGEDEDNQGIKDGDDKEAFGADVGMEAATGDLKELRLLLPTVDTLTDARDASCAGGADCESNNTAAPPSPQPRDERSMGGSELFPDDDYPPACDADAGSLVSRLGVSLYDNVAYDISRATSARAEYYNSSDGGAGHPRVPWRSSSGFPLVPVICVPTSLAKAAGDGGRGGGGSSDGTALDPRAVARSALANLEQHFSPPPPSHPSDSGPLPGANAASSNLLDLELCESGISATSVATVSGSVSAITSSVSHPMSSHDTSLRASGQPSWAFDQAPWDRQDVCEEAGCCITGDAAPVAAVEVEVEGVEAYEGCESRAVGEEAASGWGTLGSVEQASRHPQPAGMDCDGISSTAAAATAPDGGADASGCVAGGKEQHAVAAAMAAAVCESPAMEEEGGDAAAAAPTAAAEAVAGALPAPAADADVGLKAPAEESATVPPVTPLQATATAHCAGGLPSSSLQLSSSSSQPNTGAAAAGGGAAGSFPRSAGAYGPMLGSWLLSRTEPTLLDRQFQQISGALPIARKSIGHATAATGGSVSSGGGGSSSSSSVTAATATSSTSSHDWLQQRRPPSPSVKPLSLAEVLRRPPSARSPGAGPLASSR